MKYCFDLDNTLCETSGRDYENSKPIFHRIQKLNRLFDDGHYIFIYTARGMGFYEGDVQRVEQEYRELTEKNLEEWGVKYHKLLFGKPGYDIIIDDKNQTLLEFDLTNGMSTGFIAGSFDVMHPGYIKMLKEAKRYCSHLIVALHNDPSLERPSKIKPILSLEDRKDILESIRHIDLVVTYSSEEELASLLDRYRIDVRFLGDDYIEKDYTKGSKDIPIHYLDRQHGWSTTLFKKLIAQQIS